MPTFRADDLRRMSRDAFAAAGFPDAEASLIARLMVESNLVGHDSHGVRHIPIYVERIRNGDITPGAPVATVRETASTALLDGNRTLGHVAATKGVELAIAKARETAIAAVAVGHQEHVGRVGGYPEMAARAGLVGLTFCNGQGRGISIAPFGGTTARMGANPFTAAFPNPDGDPILLDISTSALAINKIRQAKDRNVALPDGAILGPDGEPSTDPEDFLGRGGAALPLGGLLYGHKGFGLAVMMDLFAGLLGGAGTARHQHDTRLDNGTFHIVIDPAAFIDEAAYAAELRAYADYIHASPTRAGDPPVKLPGEFEQEHRRLRSSGGIPVDEPVWARIVATLETLGVAAPTPMN